MAAVAIPLAVLRADLDDGWPPGARWLATGSAATTMLEQPTGSRIGFRLDAGGQRVKLRGQVTLAAPKGSGLTRIRARIAAVTPGGTEAPVWEGTVRRWLGRGLPGARRIEAELEVPAGTELVLTSSAPLGEHLLWGGLAIELDPGPATLEADRAVPCRATPAVDLPTATREGPLLSVLTPVHDPPLELLQQTLDSVREQTFGDWELCLVDDGSRDPAVRELLERSVAADPRIHLSRREQAGGISVATNAALEIASGEYIALLDHDDLLMPDALTQIAAALRERPDADLVYSDEEVFEEGDAFHTFAKPHWSPDLLRSQMYICHLGVYRRSLAQEVGGFRSEFDGSQDFDFALRISERTDRIVHVPRVLYRWRAHAGSTAGNAQAKPAAYPAARQAIAEHLERTGVEADVHFGPWDGIYRVVHRLPPGATVAVGIVGDPGGADEQRLAAAIADAESSGVPGARAVVAASAAEAVEACAGADAIVLCQEPVEPLTEGWLARLAAFALQPGVAAVGARVLALDGRVERSGYALESGLPLPIMFGQGADEPGPLGIGILPANATAIDGSSPSPARRCASSVV